MIYYQNGKAVKPCPTFPDYYITELVNLWHDAKSYTTPGPDPMDWHYSRIEWAANYFANKHPDFPETVQDLKDILEFRLLL